MKNHFILPLFFHVISLNVLGQETIDSIPKVIRNAFYQISGGTPCNLMSYENDKYEAFFYYNFTKNLMPPGLRALKTRFSSPGLELIQKFADSIPYPVVNDSNTGYKMVKGVKFFSKKPNNVARCEVTVSSYKVAEIRIDLGDGTNDCLFYINPAGDVNSFSLYIGEFCFNAHFDYYGNYIAQPNYSGMVGITYAGNILTKKYASSCEWIPLKIKNYLINNYPKCYFQLDRIMIKQNEPKEIYMSAYQKGERATFVFDNNGNLINQTEFKKLPHYRGWR